MKRRRSNQNLWNYGFAGLFGTIGLLCLWLDRRREYDFHMAAWGLGWLALGAGTLYGALNALQEKGWIAPWGGDGGRKKEFLITGLGREAASGELARLRELTETAEDIIGGETEWKSGTVTSGPCWRPSPAG